jgi:FG-GAP repeat
MSTFDRAYRPVIGILVTLAFSLTLTTANAAPPQSLIPLDNDETEPFGWGYEVAIFGDTAAVIQIASGARERPAGAGGVTIFTLEDKNWRRSTHIVPFPEFTTYSNVLDVALDGDTLALSGIARNEDPESEFAWVATWHRTVGGPWVRELLLTAIPSANEFSGEVALSRDTLLIGRPFRMSPPYPPGDVQVYVRRANGQWHKQAQFASPDSAVGDLFGLRLAVFGDRAVIGASGLNNFRGAAYVFERDDSGLWTNVATFEPDTRSNFGLGVALNEDRVVVGAPGENLFTGAAYVFRRDAAGTWTREARLAASDGVLDASFGEALAISGKSIMVGARYGGSESRGAVYVFRRSGPRWRQTAKLGSDYTGLQDEFGSSVSLSGDTGLIGAWFQDNSAGAAYVVRRVKTAH